ncbi:undecaprenyl-diphosphate phosphatase [Oligoflexaceae bacterium]|nr:undecaprenyl-diphosphate phosphatase [Oligoflexaceae bacterium]
MEYLYAVTLGVIQGITEFLPVSSSGHLIIFSDFTKGQTIPLTMNVALHMGTLLAILIYFKNEWIELFRKTLALLKSPNISPSTPNMPLAIIVGTIPAGFAGLLFKDQIEAYFHHPLATVPGLIVVGILMFVVDRRAQVNNQFSNITWVNGLFIGVAQALALIPGTSRSGITMVAGRLIGLSREDSARFSFLLGAPVMLGAVVLDFKNIAHGLTDPVFFVAVLVSFLVGWITIAALLQLLRRFGFGGFAIYRILLALTILVMLS